MTAQPLLEATGVEVSFSVGSPLAGRLRGVQHVLHAAQPTGQR